MKCDNDRQQVCCSNFLRAPFERCRLHIPVSNLFKQDLLIFDRKVYLAIISLVKFAESFAKNKFPISKI